jgi:hypothetical protein
MACLTVSSETFLTPYLAAMTLYGTEVGLLTIVGCSI